MKMFASDQTEADRHASLADIRPQDSEPLGEGWAWSDNDILRLRYAFAARFNEYQPSTEALMMVAAEGIRIAKEQADMDAG